MILRNIFNWIKAVFIWLLLKENRNLGIRYTKKAIDLAVAVSAYTTTTRDDKAAAFLAKTFDMAVKANGILDDNAVERVAREIRNINTGSLQDVTISIDNGKIQAGVGGIGAEYNPNDGSFKFGVSAQI